MKNPAQLFRKSFVALGSLLRYSDWQAGIHSEPYIFLNLEQEIQSRILRELLILFNESGYPVWLRAGLNKRTLSFAQTLVWHPKSRFIWRTLARNRIVLVVSDQIARPQLEPIAPRAVYLHFDLYPSLKLSSGHFVMPFPMHSQLYVQYHELPRLEMYRQTLRRVRGMFAGNWDERGYSNAFSWNGRTLLSRYTIISTLKESGRVRVIVSADEFDRYTRGAYANEFALLDSDVRINQAEWLQTVASSDFFLCPPGIAHPWSHNLVEAMAVGAIPLTNYAEWMFPPLQHGVNCLTFETCEDLKTRLSEIQDMSEEQIKRMRANVIGYYEEWLNPQRFVTKLFAAPENPLHLHLWEKE